MVHILLNFKSLKVDSDALGVRHHAVNATGFFFTHQAGAAQIALTLGGLFRQDVTFERVASFIFTATGLAKTLRSSAIGFDLWHVELRFNNLIQ
jgi:hypothetical protein